MKIFFSPKLGLDIARACRSGLYFFLLLFPQDPFSKQEVSGCDVVIPVGFQGSEEIRESEYKPHSQVCFFTSRTGFFFFFF